MAERQPRRIRLRDAEVQRTPADGISADEYLRMSRELMERKRELEREQEELLRLKRRGEVVPPIRAVAVFCAQYGAAQTLAENERLIIDYNNVGGEVPIQRVGKDPGAADITIHGVHRAPTRHGFHERFSAVRNITPPMRAQQATGQYPTVEDHLFGRTPRYEASTYREMPSGDLTYEHFSTYSPAAAAPTVSTSGAAYSSRGSAPL